MLSLLSIRNDWTPATLQHVQVTHGCAYRRAHMTINNLLQEDTWNTVIYHSKCGIIKRKTSNIKWAITTRNVLDKGQHLSGTRCPYETMQSRIWMF